MLGLNTPLLYLFNIGLATLLHTLVYCTSEYFMVKEVWFFDAKRRQVGDVRNRVGGNRNDMMEETEKQEIGWGRVAIHMLPLFVGWLLLQFFRISRAMGWIVFQFVAGGIVVLDTVRFIVYRSNKWGWAKCLIPEWMRKAEEWLFVHHFVREHERRWWSSSGPLAIGILVCYYFYGDDKAYVFLPAMLYAMVDPLARVFGLKCKGIKRKWLFGKSLTGAAAFMGSGIFFTWLSVILNDAFPVYPSTISHANLSLALGLGLVVATVSEICGHKFDNLVIPVASAIVMSLVI